MVKCKYCGKLYKKEAGHYLYHLSTCKKKDNNSKEVIPSQKEMWHIIKKLIKQNNLQQKKIEELENRVQKDVKKINMIEWLNANEKSSPNFEDWIKTNIQITIDDLKYIFQTDFGRGLIQILHNNIFNKNIPFKAFSHKNKELYVYNKSTWKRVTNYDIKKIFGKIQLEIIKCSSEYEKTLDESKIYGMNNAEYLKNNEKIMITEPKLKDRYQNYIKKIIIDEIKINMNDMMKFQFHI